ncbi:hypothetical protein [Fibrobacter sp.]|uniref:hypothetical protein n=1 Tax=Fibrobacter sp. TaxID=35828 RepID=UPI00388E844C
MKNTLRFLILALFGATFAFAQGAYYCVDDAIDVDGIHTYTLTQADSDDPDLQCFLGWYNTTDGGVPGLLSSALSNGEQKKLVVGSDIDFGGINSFSSSSTFTVCDQDFVPLGSAVSLEFFAEINPTTGNPYVIKNFCYAHDDGSESYYGFFNSLTSSNVHDIVFENASVLAQDNDVSLFSQVYDGVLAGSLMGTTVQSVKIDGARVQGVRAGTLAGKVNQSTIGNIVMNDVRVIISRLVLSYSNPYLADHYALGGVAGEASYSGISRVLISNLSVVDSIGEIEQAMGAPWASGYLGGIVGSMSSGKIYSCGVNGIDSIYSYTTTPDVVYLGYIVGQFEWNSSAEESVYSNYYVGKDKVDRAVGQLFVDGTLDDSYDEAYGSVDVGGYFARFKLANYRSSFDGCSVAESYYVNGCLPVEDMKTGEFAFKLSVNLDADQKWSFSEGGYPVLSSTTMEPVKVIFVGMKQLIAERLGIDEALKAFGALVKNYSYELEVYTNSEGMIDGDLYNFFKDLDKEKSNGESLKWYVKDNGYKDVVDFSQTFVSDSVFLNYTEYHVTYLVEQKDAAGNSSYELIKNTDSDKYSYVFFTNPVSTTTWADKDALIPYVVERTLDVNGDVVEENVMEAYRFFYGEDISRVYENTGNGSAYLTQDGDAAGLLTLSGLRFSNVLSLDTAQTNSIVVLMAPISEDPYTCTLGNAGTILDNRGSAVELIVDAYGKNSERDEVLMGSMSFSNIDVSDPPEIPIAEKMRVKINHPGYEIFYWTVQVCLGCGKFDWDDAELVTDPNDVIAGWETRTGAVYFKVDVDDDGYFDLSTLMDVFGDKYEPGDQANTSRVSWQLRIEPSLQKINYQVAYDKNTTAEIFYDNMTGSAPLSPTIDYELPTLYRADGYCFAGWSTEKDGTPSTTVDINLIENLDATEENILYAQWTQNTACGGVDVVLNMSGTGSVELSQSVGGLPTEKHYFEQNSQGEYVVKLPNALDAKGGAVKFDFNVNVVPDNEYVVHKFEKLNDATGEYESFRYQYDALTYTSGEVLKLNSSFVAEKGHQVVFDLQLDESGAPKNKNSLFFASENGSFEFDFNAEMTLYDDLPFVYSTEQFITSNWHAEGDESFSRSSYDLDLYESLNKLNTNKLMPKWEDVSSGDWPSSKVSGNTEHGKILLMQVVNGDTIAHEVTEQGIGLIEASAAYTFLMMAVPDEGYGNVGDVVFANNGGDSKTFFFTDIVSLDHDFLRPGEVTVTAEFAPTKNVELSLGDVDEDSVFFSENWKGFIEIVESQNSTDRLRLPEFVYTTHSCVLGWSDSDNFASYDDLFFIEAGNAEIYEAVQQSGKYELEAVWGSAEQCTETRYGFVQLELKDPSKTVVLRELKPLEGGTKDTVDHPFGKDGTILFPSRIQDRFSFHGDSAFISAEFTDRNSQTYIFEEGDLLEGFEEGRYKVVVYSKTTPDNKPFVLAKHDVWLSGNVLFVDFAVPDSIKDEFQDVFVTLENDSEVVAERYVFLQDGGDDEKIFGPLPAGNYRLNALAFVDGERKSVFEQKFAVSNEIAADCEDCWHMVALDNVDFEKLDFDDDDAQIYWWNESVNYGWFWQYHRFYKNSAVENGRGYWYSSIEGRPLVLRERGESGAQIDNQNVEPVVWTMDSVYSGWNMVSNPYSWDVDLYGENDNRDVVFYRWNSKTGQYEETSVIGANESVWAHVSKETEWRLPKTPTFAYKLDSVGKKQFVAPSASGDALKKSANEFGWTLQAVLTDKNGKMDSWNFVGVADNEKSVEEPPAGMGSRVMLSIAENNRALTKCYRKAERSGSYEWTLEASATSNRLGYLSFAGVKQLNSMGLAVYATIDGQMVEMHEGESLTIPLSQASKKVMLYVGGAPKANALPNIANVRAMQTGGTLVVNFDAFELTNGAMAQVDLVSIRGEVVSSASFKTVAGTNRLSMSLPKPGLYMVRIRVGNATSFAKIVTR